MKKLIIGLLTIIMALGGTASASKDMRVYAPHQGVMIYEENERVGLMRSDGTILCDAIYEYIYPFVNDVSSMTVDGLEGLLRNDGVELSPAQWDWTCECSDGRFIVKYQGRAHGVLNRDGTIFLEPIWSNIFEEGGWYYASADECSQTVFNEVGDVVLEMSALDISAFHDGFANVEYVNGREGYINIEGKPLKGLQFDKAYDFSDGIAVFSRGGSKTTWGIIDTNGEILLEMECDYIHYGFSDGMTYYRKDEKYGYVDAAGRIVIDAIWDDAKVFYSGRAFVKMGDWYTLIDKTGARATEEQWESVCAFKDGVARVKSDGKWRLIDARGEYVSDAAWDWIDEFYEGIAAVNENGRQYFIDRQGKTVMNQTWIAVSEVYRGYAFVKGDDGLWSAINMRGEAASPEQFILVNGFQEYGMEDYTGARAKDGNFYWINEKGELLGPADQWDVMIY